MKNNWQKLPKILKNDDVAIIPTDTIYGLVGSAFSRKAVEKIYKIKERDKNKALIVLVSSYEDLEIFGIKIEKDQAKILGEFWPGKVSVILPCRISKWKYIHRGLNSIAFRMVSPKNKNLFNLIKKVGPIVAPSANPESKTPAISIKRAQEYFGDSVSLYINGGEKKMKPSTLVTFESDGKLKILRQGQLKIKSKKKE